MLTIRDGPRGRVHHVRMGIDGEQLTRLVNVYLPPADAEAFMGLARPAIALRHTSSGTASRAHLGGDAALEPDQTWPMWHGKPLSLLAVLDLEALLDLDSDLELPRSGFLNLFYDDDEQPWGFDPVHAGGWRTILAAAGTAEDRAEPGGGTRFNRIDLAPEQILTVPGWEEDVLTSIPHLAPYAFDDRAEALYAALHEATEGSGPHHQVGGWPDLQQGPLWRELQFASNGVYVGDPAGYEGPRAAALLAGVGDWRLLAQIDTDDDAGWMWGDVGTLYFGTRNEDLARTDLDRGWMVLQCG